MDWSDVAGLSAEEIATMVHYGDRVANLAASDYQGPAWFDPMKNAKRSNKELSD